jgi:hypothetical protein
MKRLIKALPALHRKIFSLATKRWFPDPVTNRT